MKKAWLIGVISLLSIPMALADVTETLGNVAKKIVEVFNLGFLGVGSDDLVIAFTRMLIWILLFTVFFAVIQGLGGKSGFAPMKFFSRGQGALVAGIVATIGAIFMPAEILAATGAGWATLISLILIGGPVVGVAVLMWKFPKEGDTKSTVALKIIMCFLLIWILASMSHHLGRLGI